MNKTEQLRNLPSIDQLLRRPPLAALVETLSRQVVVDGARAYMALVRQQLAEMKPFTTVPVMRDLAADQQRTTKIQLRGNVL